MAEITIVAGTSADLEFQLLDNGSPINLLNVTVTLLLSDRTGTTVASPGTVSIVDSDNGKVKLSPTDENVFVASKSPYMARFKLVDASSKVSYCPSTSRDVWNIVGA